MRNLRLYACLMGILAGAVGAWPVRAQSAVHVKGRITSNGNPVQGEIVAVYFERQVRTISYQSDSMGAFAFDIAGGARTLLVAKADGYISSEQELTPNRGEIVNVRFTLSPAGPVSGRVLDEAGIGVPGAVVRVRYPGERRSYHFGDELGEETADDLGNFTLPFVAEDRPFVVEAETTDRLPSSSNVLRFERAVASGVVVVVGPVGHIVRGRVSDAAGAPVADALVRMQCLPEPGEFSEDERNFVAFLSRTNKRMATGPDGTYEFRGIPVGRVIVVASRPGMRPVKGEGTIETAPVQIDLTLK